MSRYFQVLERAERVEELVPSASQPTLRPDGKLAARSVDGLIREEVTKLVQRVFLLPKDGGAPRVVLFCGIEHGEGSSWICARAGQTLAKQGSSTVCLVDANLRSPSLHSHFGVENRRGLADALFQTGSIGDYAQSLGSARLWLVPSGTVTPEVYTRLGGELMQNCFGELRSQFNHVLIDAPPADLYADAAVVGKLTDGVVLVVEANSTRRETARQVRESLNEANLELLGAVLHHRTFPIPDAIYRRL
ncbi:MAG: CpsD/CapB family tyrosine-protein kinase [Acidobacteria bacterium]|nr:CpsD/CapB family tyrosine-protein kinase [Acidobacteriota bacterium]